MQATKRWQSCTLRTRELPGSSRFSLSCFVSAASLSLSRRFGFVDSRLVDIVVLLAGWLTGFWRQKLWRRRWRLLLLLLLLIPGPVSTNSKHKA
jgi:hypothetical protein